MKWMIIGTGNISKLFCDALIANNEVVESILSRSINTAKKFAEKVNAKKYSDNFDNISDVDCVYIGTPNSTHFDFALRAITEGKDVMIEKPMTHSFELTKKLYDLASMHNVKVMEAYAHITNKELQNVKGIKLETNLMQLSSKIKNHTYQTASTFNKDMFGGVIPDLGVYPISLAISWFGNVKDISISEIKYLNNVEVECLIKLNHFSDSISIFKISKINDGDKKVFLDGKQISVDVSMGHIKNRMNAEVSIFKSGKDLNKYKNISIETARVVEVLKFKC